MEKDIDVNVRRRKKTNKKQFIDLLVDVLLVFLIKMSLSKKKKKVSNVYSKYY